MRVLIKSVAATMLAGGVFLGGLGWTPTTTVGQPPPGERKEERHPHIHRAIRELREARKELQEADHDFGGHRKEAVEAIDLAIRQLEEALRHDRR